MIKMVSVSLLHYNATNLYFITAMTLKVNINAESIGG